MNIPAPIERLNFFKAQLEIQDDDFDYLRQNSQLFLGEKENFSEWFYDYFLGLSHTKSVLEHESYDLKLKKIWGHWFDFIFSTSGGDDFVIMHWRSGLKHVQIGLDHRYINMAYGLARRFLHQVINRKLQADERDRLGRIVDKVLDLSILIETDAFISSTTQCDHEVIRGIAHQVRNPLTVIGGNIMLLQKKVNDDDPRKGIYDTMLQEAKRMERMVKNVVMYNEVFQKEPDPEPCNVDGFIMEAIKELKAEDGDTNIDVHLDENNNQVFADKEGLKIIIFHVLQNAFEASKEADSPRVKISSRVSGSKPEFLEIKVVNNGPVPDEKTLSQIFTPFFSTKAMGTGFGLPIVKLTARKNQGNFRFEIVEDAGIVSIITLPLPKR